MAAPSGDSESTRKRQLEMQCDLHAAKGAEDYDKCKTLQAQVTLLTYRVDLVAKVERLASELATSKDVSSTIKLKKAREARAAAAAGDDALHQAMFKVAEHGLNIGLIF